MDNEPASGCALLMLASRRMQYIRANHYTHRHFSVCCFQLRNFVSTTVATCLWYLRLCRAALLCCEVRSSSEGEKEE